MSPHALILAEDASPLIAFWLDRLCLCLFTTDKPLPEAGFALKNLKAALKVLLYLCTLYFQDLSQVLLQSLRAQSGIICYFFSENLPWPHVYSYVIAVIFDQNISLFQ